MANFLDLTTGLPALWAKIKSKFYTKAEVDAAIPSASSTSPEMDGTAAVGASTAYARADHVHPSDTSRVTVNQGTANAGKVLTVGSNGNVIAAAIPNEIMVVNITYDNVNKKYVADKTTQEIVEFVNNGGVAVVNNYGSKLLCNNVISDVNENYYYAGFYYAAVEDIEGSTSVYGNGVTIKHENGIESVNITQGNNSIPSPAGDSDGLPIMNGTASRGDSINYARANHVHPNDTSKADKWYGYCTSGEQTQNKEVNINGFTSTNLVAGTKVTIKFRYSNQVDQPTLNISGTGAKPILTTGIATNASQEVNRQTAMAYEWNSGIFTFVYDGYSNWIMESQQHATTSYFGVTKLSNTISNNTTTALTPSAVYNAGYALSSNVLTKTNTTSYTPTADYHPATKKYVDDNVGVISVNGNTGDVRLNATDVGAVPSDTSLKREDSTSTGIVTFKIGHAASDGAQGNIKLSNSFNGNHGYTIIEPSATTAASNSTTTIKLPTSSGTLALTTDISTTLSGLADTNISNPTDGQVLQYDSTTSKWVNATLPTGITETRVNELIAAALAQYGDGDAATYGYTDVSEVNY